MHTLPAVAIIGLKLRAVFRYTKLPDRSPFQAFTIEMPALQFYASLDSGSLTKATHDGIACTQLGSTQRQLFEQAALEGVFLGSASTGFTVSLARMANTDDVRGLGFLMRKETALAGGQAVDGQAMLFGANVSEATIYKVPVAE